MKFRKGAVVRKRRVGWTKCCEEVGVTKTHATLRSVSVKKKGSVMLLVVRLDENGFSEGYEVKT